MINFLTYSQLLEGLILGKSIFGLVGVLFVVLFFISDIKANTKSCIPLHKINVNENEILDKSAEESLYKPFYKKCIDQKLLKDILNTISQFYMDKGYVTTKAYLKEQDILDGELDVTILKGVVEDIVHSDTKKSSMKLKTAFILQKGKILNLRDLETSLESINRVPSMDATFEIKPGTSYGKSIIEVKSEEVLPYHFMFGVTGEKSLSDNNPDLTGAFSWDNPLNINDILSLTYNGSRIQREYQSTKGTELNYSFPLGSYLYELILSNTKYRQSVEGINETYITHGKTNGWKFKTSKVLHRDQTNKFTLSGMLYHKDTENYFEDSFIEVRSYKTTLAQIDLQHLYLQPWGQLSTTYSYYKGEDWFGAREDDWFGVEGDTSDGAKLQFDKYTLDSYLVYYFKDKSYSFDSNFHLQYTKDRLYYNDQLVAGSRYTVRGYSDTSLYGDNGFYLRNNIAKEFTLNFDTDYLQTLFLYLGFDFAKIKCIDVNENNCGKISGGTIGFKTDSKYLSSDFSLSRPFKKIGDESRLHSLLNYSITLKF